MLPMMDRPCALALLLGLLIPVASAAEESSETRSRQEEVFESASSVTVTSRRVLQDRVVSSVAQGLDEEIGLFLWHPFAGGLSPILRGRMGQHVIVLVDDVRITNSITRDEGRLAAISLGELERVEVEGGSGTVRHGAGAMGGVIQLSTRAPRLDRHQAWTAGSELGGQFDSANLGGAGYLTASGSLRNMGLQLGGTLRRSGDLYGGRGTGYQPNTGDEEADAHLTAAWAISDTSRLDLTYSTLRQYDRFQPEISSITDYLRTANELQDRAVLHYRARLPFHFAEQLKVSLVYHVQREQQELVQQSGAIQERSEEQVNTLGVVLALASTLPRHRLRYGVDLYHDWISASATDETSSTPEPGPGRRSRYTDGSRALEASVFAEDALALTEKMTLDLGARVSTWRTHLPSDALTRLPGLEAQHTMVVGELHGRYLLGDGLNLVAGVSQGYRPPSVDELSGLGYSGPGYQLPSLDVKPELSLTAEAGLKLDLFGVLTGSTFYSFSYLDDPIVRRLSIWPYSDPFTCRDSRGQPCAVFRRANGEQATLQTLEATFRLHLQGGWSLITQAAWVRGTVQLDPLQQEPLSQLPPIHGLASVRYEWGDSAHFVELGLRWAAPQERLSEVDLHDVRICPRGFAACSGTSGYAVGFARGGLQIAKPLRLGLALENVSNKTYRLHGSALDSAGISGRAQVEWVMP
jgi:hemoglobin/transferrin/lactoferrin receptor protein